MLPGHLIVEFWLTVEQQLRKEHRLTEERARLGIDEFRKRLDLRGIGEMVYHNNPEDVAKTIAGIIRQGGFEKVDPLPGTDSGTTRAVI